MTQGSSHELQDRVWVVRMVRPEFRTSDALDMSPSWLDRLNLVARAVTGVLAVVTAVISVKKKGSS